jgi:NADPH2:quinone reductase
VKAIVIDQFGGPEVLVERDLPLPKPSRNEVRVKIKAIGFNPVDVKKRTGVYGDPLPSILGADFSGVIDAVGDPLGEFAVGDRVFGFTDGTYAEEICVSTQLITKIPKNLSFEEAAVIPVVYVTAFQGLVGTGALQQNRPLFIAGGSGGVGTAAIHLAKAYQAGPVFTMAGSKESRDYLIQQMHIPSHQILDYKGLSVEETAKKLIEMNGGSRYYFAFDTVGGKVKEVCLEIADFNGHVATVLPEDENFPYPVWGRKESIFWHKSLSLHMIFLFASLYGSPPDRWRVYKSQLNHLAKLFEKGELPRPQFKNMGPFSADTAQKAHGLIGSGKKMVMTQFDSS